MTQDDVLSELVAIGFKYQSTASRRWRIALFHRNATKTLVVLVRRRGIDLLETPLEHREMLNDAGLLSVTMQRAGDRFVELSYIDSEVSIPNRLLEACSEFAQDREIPEACFGRQGIGPKEWGAKYGVNTQRKECTSNSEMHDIYYAASRGDGEAGYLGDGMWITPSGSIEERD